MVEIRRRTPAEQLTYFADVLREGTADPVAVAVGLHVMAAELEEGTLLSCKCCIDNECECEGTSLYQG